MNARLRGRRYLVLAVLALGLIANSAGITSADSPVASSGPAMLSTYLGTQAAAIYTRAARLAGEMRLLYQVTRLEELQLQPIGAGTKAATAESSPRVILCKDSVPAGHPKKART